METLWTERLFFVLFFYHRHVLFPTVSTRLPSQVNAQTDVPELSRVDNNDRNVPLKIPLTTMPMLPRYAPLQCCCYIPHQCAAQAKVEQLAHARFVFSAPAWKTISSGGKEFVRNLLKKQPGFRWTARQALDHCADKWGPSLSVRPCLIWLIYGPMKLRRVSEIDTAVPYLPFCLF